MTSQTPAPATWPIDREEFQMNIAEARAALNDADRPASDEIWKHRALVYANALSAAAALKAEPAASDKALDDARNYGAGFYRVNADGTMDHIPLDKIQQVTAPQPGWDREAVIAVIMGLLKEREVEHDKNVSIEALEKILNSEEVNPVRILPDGRVVETVPTTTTVGKLADAFIAAFPRPRVTREQIARLVCYWMPTPPHATCHDNYCVSRCMAKADPYNDRGEGAELERGLADALLALIEGRS